MEMPSSPPEMKVQPSPNTNSDLNDNKDSNKSDNDEALLVSNDAPNYSTQTESEYFSSQQEREEIEARRQQRILNLKFLNGCSFLLTAVITLGTVLFGASSGYGSYNGQGSIWGDEYLWMKYQTLITPSEYTDWIWCAIFAFQGLFCWVTIMRPSFAGMEEVGDGSAGSKLAGYDKISGNYPGICSMGAKDAGGAGGGTGGAFSNMAASANRSPVAIYPGVCVATILTIYCFDHGYILLAFVASLFITGLLVKIMKIQTEVLNQMEVDGLVNNNHDDGNVNEGSNSVGKSGCGGGGCLGSSGIRNTGNTTPITLAIIKQYLTLRLPFELYGGYALTLNFLFFNTYLSQLFDKGDSHLSTYILVTVSNFSLIAVLCVGSWILWRTRRHFYGVSAGLVWFFVGVAIELINPSQPIYNEFTDDQITLTQAIASVSSTLLMVLLSVRVIKTIIKRTSLIVPCGQHCGDGEDEYGEADADIDENIHKGEKNGEISTGYVHAEA